MLGHRFGKRAAITGDWQRLREGSQGDKIHPGSDKL